MARTAILWRQVGGLAALLAAITFSFMVYGYYQPKILAQLGFTTLATHLAIIQSLLGAIAEPLAGSLSDRILQRVGSRLPQIAVGVTLAGLLFVASALLLLGNLPVKLRWLIPVVMTAWVLAMILFRGPAIALLRQFAPTDRMPQANAVLTLTLCLTGALGPIIGSLMQQVGASLAFLLGAVVLVAGAGLLYSTAPQVVLATSRPVGPSLRLSQFIGIALLGILTGGLSTLALRWFPAHLNSLNPHFRTDYGSTAILLIAALATMPLETAVMRWGIQRSFFGGLIGLGGLLLLALWSRHPAILQFGCLPLLGVTFGLTLISQIPFVLATVPPKQAGLITGLYFGGMGLGNALLS